MSSSGMLRRVALVTKFGELRTTLAVTSNRRALQRYGLIVTVTWVRFYVTSYVIHCDLGANTVCVLCFLTGFPPQS
jgi:hypothetical protein